MRGSGRRVRGGHGRLRSRGRRRRRLLKGVSGFVDREGGALGRLLIADFLDSEKRAVAGLGWSVGVGGWVGGASCIFGTGLVVSWVSDIVVAGGGLGMRRVVMELGTGGLDVDLFSCSFAGVE